MGLWRRVGQNGVNSTCGFVKPECIHLHSNRGAGEAEEAERRVGFICRSMTEDEGKKTITPLSELVCELCTWPKGSNMKAGRSASPGHRVHRYQSAHQRYTRGYRRLRLLVYAQLFVVHMCTLAGNERAGWEAA